MTPEQRTVWGVVALLLAVLVWRLRRLSDNRVVPFRSIVDPGAHAPNPKCLDVPVSCVADADCDVCADALAMRCETQERDSLRGTERKFCVPAEKPARPCDAERGGRWLYTGWGRVDHSIENDWECQCAFPNVAGRIEEGVGCGVNHDVCRGGVWEDGSWEFAAPDPTKCVCPEGTQRIVRAGIKPMCLPLSTVCRDEASCNDAWNR